MTLWLLGEATKRFFEPPQVKGKIMLIVAVMGLFFNLIQMRILHSGDGHYHLGGEEHDHDHEGHDHGHDHCRGERPARRLPAPRDLDPHDLDPERGSDVVRAGHVLPARADLDPGLAGASRDVEVLLLLELLVALALLLLPLPVSARAAASASKDAAESSPDGEGRGGGPGALRLVAVGGKEKARSEG